MRWDNLRMTAEEERRLPGYSDAAVVRRFDAPEAMGINFYEVRAKSALNRVPDKSMVPFRWTINPYRGCTHACVWCMAGETPILMADGRAKPLEHVRAGDAVYGTVGSGTNRAYAATRVIAHWSTLKPAYRLELEDGTELIASGDHRFLTDRGWRCVQPAERPAPRPYLTTGDALMGVGRLAERPDQSSDYRTGYLSGVLRADARLGGDSCMRANGATGRSAHLGLGLVDLEALQRTRAYLESEGVATRESRFAEAVASARPLGATGASAVLRTARTRGLTAWPRRAGDDWCKGFLAGIYDAEGGYSRGMLRISNGDPVVVDWIRWCLTRFGFDHVVDAPSGSDGLTVVRVRRGLREHLRFFQMVDPAITRKRTFEGSAVASDAELRVRAVEPLGLEMPMYDITTGTGDFVANGVISHNCFARPTHKFLDMNAGRDFEREIVVKVNAPEVLRAQLARPSWKREHVALGTNTDPYQWVEGRYRLMRGIWEAMRDFSNPCSVLTKSPLLTRDIDLFQQIAERTTFTANLSIPTIDEKVWRQTEPHTPSPRARIEAVAELTRAGIACGVLIAPLMPGVNDQPEQVDEILRLCTEAGATQIGGICLHLRGDVRELWFDWLRSHRPDLIPRYEALYARGAYAPAKERERIARLVGKRAADQSDTRRNSRRLMRGTMRADEPEGKAAPVKPGQGALF